MSDDRCLAIRLQFLDHSPHFVLLGLAGITASGQDDEERGEKQSEGQGKKQGSPAIAGAWEAQ